MPNINRILDEIFDERSSHEAKARSASDVVRRRYLEKIHEHTGRSLIAYYSGFLTHPGLVDTTLTDEDMVGFMATIHQMDRTNGLDLILHTPGGAMSAAISIVNYLRMMFTDIRAIVPHTAMSAGTMIACSCDRIVMAKHSQLGPIDPQLQGIAAAGVQEEFERACDEIAEDPSRAVVWQSIIGKYPPTFLSQCENVVARSKEWVRDQLCEHMFAACEDAKGKADGVVGRLSSYNANKGHDRPVFAAECKEIGLEVDMLEKDQEFQDLILSAHHCYMHAFMNGVAVKIIENHKGAAIARQLPQG
jgi:ATP-dependent protease ClpP protease subunit